MDETVATPAADSMVVVGPTNPDTPPESSPPKRPSGSRRIEGRVECEECQGEVLVIAAPSDADPPTKDTVVARRFVLEPWIYSLTNLPNDIPTYVRIRWDRSGKIKPGTPNPLVSGFIEFAPEDGVVLDRILTFE